MRKLMTHQKDAVRFFKEEDRAAFFMEMRLGKTLTSIRWARRRDAETILVLTPIAAFPGWERDLTLDEESYCYFRSKKDRLEGVRKGHFHILNPEAVRANPDILSQKWDAIILDESPLIKNPKSKISKVMTNNVEHIRCRALLSGWPSPDSLLDLFQQYKFLYGNFMGAKNYWQFRKRYFETSGPWGWSPRKGSRELIKEESDRLAFCLTRKQAGIGSKKIYETRHTPLPPKLMKEYNAIARDYERDGEETKYAVVVNNWLGQLAGSDHKDSELMNLLTGELKNEQVVIWFRFRDEIRRIKNRLRSAGIPCNDITGSTRVARRRTKATAFGRGRFRVLLCQLQTSRFGADFSAADTAIYYSCSYSSQDRIQSMDRIIHPRKTSPVLIVDLVTPGTVDQDIREALVDKEAEGGLTMRKSAVLSLVRAKGLERCLRK